MRLCLNAVFCPAECTVCIYIQQWNYIRDFQLIYSPRSRVILERRLYLSLNAVSRPYKQHIYNHICNTVSLAMQFYTLQWNLKSLRDSLHDSSQNPLFRNFLIRLHLVSNFEVLPVLEAHTTFSALAHFGNVFLDIFERGKCTYRPALLALCSVEETGKWTYHRK